MIQVATDKVLIRLFFNEMFIIAAARCIWKQRYSLIFEGKVPSMGSWKAATITS